MIKKAYSDWTSEGIVLAPPITLYDRHGRVVSRPGQNVRVTFWTTVLPHLSVDPQFGIR